MDALEALLRPVANLLNRNIQAVTPAREQCRDLSGRVVAVRVRDTALAAWFVMHDDTLELLPSSELEPDVTIEGSLLTLARMAGGSGEAAVRYRNISLSGDAETAAAFQKLLAFAKPDIEEELSSVVGDVAAHRLGEIARGLGRWGREARSTMGANVREYLQEESRDAPSRYETERFASRVNTLRDDVARLEARIKRLQDARQ
ncbi:MAG: SCP2 sterol-binding domain-containing protein [Gammaproteobacteria bacterium]|nr:SCP2 sterol-binding domain-containing protein [Gammaproteobacteria bacterium]